MATLDPHPQARVHVPAIVLAAGLSTRMGTFKPVLELRGEKLVCRVVRSLLESGRISEVVVVVGHHRDQVQHALQGMTSVRLVYNPDFATGEMLSSLRTGLAAIDPQNPVAFVLAFADQPAVEPQTVAELVRQWAADVRLVIPTHGGRRGHPLLLSRELTAEIRQLPATETLRTVVHRHLANAIMVEVPDASILEDLDTPADLERARARYGN